MKKPVFNTIMIMPRLIYFCNHHFLHLGTGSAIDAQPLEHEQDRVNQCFTLLLFGLQSAIYFAISTERLKQRTINPFPSNRK
ncbi:unnamed protein product [Amoebophrya sp. A25]|nr:unnamed protein product [Amoebophrya sp. A25]|eukprot:GSA25T00007310001.1